jgi:hypothetical protein
VGGNTLIITLELIKSVIYAQNRVVKYEHGNTICPVCEMAGLLPTKVTVTCTVEEIRYCCCETCSSTFRAAGESRNKRDDVKLPDSSSAEAVKSPEKADKKPRRKHNRIEDSECGKDTQATKETSDGKKQKRNKRRADTVSSGA